MANFNADLWDEGQDGSGRYVQPDALLLLRNDLAVSAGDTVVFTGTSPVDFTAT